MKLNLISLIILVILSQSIIAENNPEGYIYTTDTVTQEHIAKKIYDYKIKVPLEFYLGGWVGGNGKEVVKYVNVGFMIKDKNRLHGVYTGVDIHGQIQFGMQSYWRIGVKKK